MNSLLRSLVLGLFLISSLASAKLNLLQEVDKGLWRGSQPKTEDDFRQLKKMGIKVIVNIQRPDDKSVEAEKALAEKYGIEFSHLPLVATGYPDDKEMNLIFKEIEDRENYPVYFHCTLGRDRTGLVAALYRVFVQHWTAAKAYKEWTDMGFSSKFLVNLDKYFRDKTGFAKSKGTCAAMTAAVK